MHGHAVVGEQGGQERAQNAPLGGPSVEEQRGGDVVASPHHLGAARQEVQDPFAQDRVENQGLKLNDEFGGYYGVAKITEAGVSYLPLFNFKHQLSEELTDHCTCTQPICKWPTQLPHPHIVIFLLHPSISIWSSSSAHLSVPC